MTADFLCVIGHLDGNWHWVKNWLDEKKERRLVFINAPLLFAHPQVKYKSIDSPLQLEPIAKEIAWEAVFLKLEIIGEKWDMFRNALEQAHLAANLILSDASDWGCAMAKQAFARKNRPLREGLKLAKAFPNVPAIIVGAGPSLAKNGHLLELFQSQALIFTGGSALATLQTEPHFAAAIDKEAPQRHFKRFAYWETPFCVQHRMNFENFSLIHGEAILFPDSHFQFLNEAQVFDGGWTVGTFLTALASFMGCNPIVFTGMDYCYENGCKYAEGIVGAPQNLVNATTTNGVQVSTQPDWLMAKAWLETFAAKHPEQIFLNATEGGMGFSSPIQNVVLSDLKFEKRNNLRNAVYDAVASLPFVCGFDWNRWKESLHRCAQIAERSLLTRSALNGQSSSLEEEENFEGERAYESLLLPLWQTWSPIFNRALEFDSNPKKMKINRLLFFQNVIQEHLHAIE
ncbi:MAG TPA: 6-hydroxymethylpterin diphosphokinase MptE-like protein [Chlamydiales bacterium]|nr:6-hydroxymethylpterin diphosphokinase MptE-like protein [Chlamydiales bacterium]